MKKTREECGCEHRDGRWIKLCTDDEAKWSALHEQAMQDHRDREKEKANGTR